ncbi:helix-turn-helix transcriptional regulator [Burkholderia guangdongensis]|uniref:helix-turn-helix transcriptional regulator n=1 Tax=Burkholderia guangdongensis TaxID=1792500 RepID=UPI0015CC4EC6|nr:helix-turn-helix transcriptional regulator [Burkholderia guangdongensis]
MNLEWQDLAFHREIATVIDALDGPHFWPRLVRVLERHVAVDAWVALRFARNGAPHVCAEQALPDGQVDLLFQEYVSTFYQLDPFYLDAFERRESGFHALADVAPDNFTATEYYQRYFQRNIIGDEVHFNVAVDSDHVIGFSLSKRQRYDAREMSLLTLVAPWVIALMQQRLRFEDVGRPAPSMPAADIRSPDLRERLVMFSERVGHGALTAREIDVTMLSLSGHSSRAIADRLAISFETVRTYKKHIYAKLGVGSQSSLFSMFYEWCGTDEAATAAVERTRRLGRSATPSGK